MQDRADSENYDKTIDVLSDALRKARLDNSEKPAAIRSLQAMGGPG